MDSEMIVIWTFVILLLFYILDKWISTKEDFKRKRKKKSGGGGGGSSLPSTAIATITSMIALGGSIFKEVDALVNIKKDFEKGTTVKLPNDTTPTLPDVDMQLPPEPTYPEAKV
jgi:hypothetical protein